MGGVPIGQNVNGSFEFRHNKDFLEENKYTFNVGNIINIDANSNNNNENANNTNYKIIIEEFNNELLEKYATEEWNNFYKNNVLDLINQYANKEWPIIKEGNMSDFLFEENKDENSTDKEKLNEKIISDENNLTNPVKEEGNISKNEENIKTE